MSAMEIDSVWTSAFGEESMRPILYTSEELNDEGYYPLNDPQNFIMNLNTLSPQQLYAASSNNQIAMKLAQDEYLEIEQQIANIKGKETIKNPQFLPAPDGFEERKEASLYCYKYEVNRPALLLAGHPGLKSAEEVSDREKQDVRLFQEPFAQGGFVPTDRVYKTMVSKAKDPKNVDGWEPVIKNGRRLTPRQQNHLDEYNITYVKRNVDANGEIVRPVSQDSDIPVGTPDKLNAVNKALIRTRYGGLKVPRTGDTSELPSGASTPRGRKRTSPSGEGSRDETANSKRLKVNAANGPELQKPKHPNQYTKRNEKEAKERLEGEQGLIANNAASAAANTTTNTTVAPQATAKPAPSSKVHWRELSPDAKYNRAWTNIELHEAVRDDHSWLNPDPLKAEKWRVKLLQNETPIRSFAMFKKWRQWQLEGKDKRPRNKKRLSSEDGATNERNESRPQSQKSTSKRRKPKNPEGSGASTPAVTPASTRAATPAPEVPEVTDTRPATPVDNVKRPMLKHTLRPRAPARGETPRQKAIKEEKQKQDGLAEVDRASSGSRSSVLAAEESSPQQAIEEVNGNSQKLRRPSLKKQESESTIVVSTSTARLSINDTPRRRSERVSRRPSY